MNLHINRISLIVSTIILALAVNVRVPAQTAVAPTTGDGLTSATAFQITELGNLVWLDDQATTGATDGVYYILMNDIDASETVTWNDDDTSTDVMEGFKPVGDEDTPFKGFFLGHNKAIKNMHIDRSDASYTGIFGNIEAGLVSSLIIHDAYISGYQYTGGLAGYCSNTTIENCKANGYIHGAGTYTGGLIGEFDNGSITNCVLNMTVHGGFKTGGLAGSVFDGDVTDSQIYCSITGGTCSGGICGLGEGCDFLRCKSTGSISGAHYTGGLAGHIYSTTIKMCHSSCEVNGANTIGGMVGRAQSGTIENCYATGDVNGANTVGGMVGRAQSETIENCYATGDVNGDEKVGGLLGHANRITASYCYATGKLTGTYRVGGVLGYCSSGTRTACYWNIDTCGVTTSFGGTGLSTAQMMRAESFENWDFDSPVWGINGGYPYLTELDTCSLSYSTDNNGLLSDETTTAGLLNQTINIWGSGTPITPVPNRLFRFSNWNDGSLLSPRIDNGLTTDTTIMAIFSRLCTVEYIAGANGSVNGLPSISQTVNVGSLGPEVSAIPDPTCAFSQWSDGSKDNPRIDLAQNNLTVTASFATAREGFPPFSGDGESEETAFEINELGHLVWLSQQANDGLTDGVYYKMTTDIDASPTKGWDYGFDPIGNAGGPFEGYFLGEGHTITGLYINKSSLNYVGLFAYGYCATITNLGMVDVDISTGFYTGGLIGKSQGCQISSCYSSGSVSGNYYVGGLVGYSVRYYKNSYDCQNDTYQNCYSSADVTGDDYTGGLIGYVSRSEIVYCYAKGSVQSGSYAGGLVGYSEYIEINKCYASGAASGGWRRGGLIGGTLYTNYITDSYWNADLNEVNHSGQGTGLSTAQMFDAANYENWTFNGSSGWGRDGGYPYLVELEAYKATYDTQTNGYLSDGVSSGTLLAQTVNRCGLTGPITAIPDDGHYLSCWSDGSKKNTRSDDNLTSDTIFTAIFSDQCELTYIAGEDGAIDGITSKTLIVNYGEDGEAVEAQPDDGFRFVEWDDYSTENPRTDENMVDDLTVTAEFTDGYILTYLTDEYGYIADADTAVQAVAPGYDGVAVTAEANTGYHFSQWSDDVSTEVRTDTGIASDLTATAEFEINTYTLKYFPWSNGTIDGMTSRTLTVEYMGSGEVVTAIPDEGYVFAYWSDCSIDNPRTDTDIDDDHTYRACFVPSHYQFSYVAGEQGSIDGLTSRTLIVEYMGSGEVVTAIPDEGYVFAYWSDGVEDNPRTDIDVTEDMTVTAVFALDRYVVTYLAGEHGTIDGETSRTLAVSYNGTGEAVGAVAADEGYEFDGWSDGVRDNPRTDSGVTADLTVTANFSLTRDGIKPLAGNGYEDTPHEIRTLGNLVWLSDRIQDNYSMNCCKLMNDIDASVTATWNDENTTTDVLEGFYPICDEDHYNWGTFQGQGYKIINLHINRPEMNYVGLFGRFLKVDEDEYICDLGLEGGSITGNAYVGGLSGYAGLASISNCYCTASVSGSGDCIGGLIGDCDGSIENCYATGAVSGDDCVGGLIGGAGSASISNCYCTASVSGSGDCIGGLIGDSHGSIENCYATGAVSGDDCVGGLLGFLSRFSGSAINCHASGAVTASGRRAGGLIGGILDVDGWFQCEAVVTDCYATGPVSGVRFVGGLVGFASYQISECYATGAVYGDEYVGGLVGFNTTPTSIEECYAHGAVTASNDYAGGLAGGNWGVATHCYAANAVTGAGQSGGFAGTLPELASQEEISCYWNGDLMAISGVDNATSLTTLQMKHAASFEGWDFDNVWAIDGGYPYLQSLPVCTLTYEAVSHGTVGDGLTNGVKSLGQVINPGASGTPVTAAPAGGYGFAMWYAPANAQSGDANPRTDIGFTEDALFRAFFVPLNGVGEWMGYQ